MTLRYAIVLFQCDVFICVICLLLLEKPVTLARAVYRAEIKFENFPVLVRRFPVHSLHTEPWRTIFGTLGCVFPNKTGRLF